MTVTLSAQAPTQPAMTLAIPGFPDGGQIPVKFSQAAPGVAIGEGTSPAMSWNITVAATAALTAILGREAIYTRQVTTWAGLGVRI